MFVMVETDEGNVQLKRIPLFRTVNDLLAIRDAPTPYAIGMKSGNGRHNHQLNSFPAFVFCAQSSLHGASPMRLLRGHLRHRRRRRQYR